MLFTKRSSPAEKTAIPLHDRSLPRWASRLSLIIVVSLALGAPFTFAPTQALWLMPLLLLAASGIWFSQRKGPESIEPATLATVATAPTSPSEQLVAELSQLRTMQTQLLQAKQEAEAAMMAKGEFLATMSHEIRTPLNGIIPLLDILLSSKLAPDQMDYLQTAYKSARELLRIVDDILDYSKIEAKKLDLEEVGLNLRELADGVVQLLGTSAQAKGIKLNVQIDPAVRLAARGDPVRLRQVLTNLVSNAIKFTQRGAIAIQISRRGETHTHNELLFAVKDTGIGIAPEAASRLFQPFSQADTSTTRMHGGTGLGLVICKRIVELMNGKIGVKSELGRGSVFWFQVPLLKALGDVAETRRDLNGLRILIQTSETALLRRLSGYFGAWGIHSLPTTTVAETLAQLRSTASMGERWAYDVVLIDLQNLRGNSVALLRNLMREPTLDRVRMLALVGAEEPSAELRNEPRVALLARQFAEGQLRETLQKLLGISDAHESQAALAHAQIAPPEVDILTPSRKAAPPLKAHVLLVEDNPVNAQVAQRLLSLMGVNVTVAEHGKAALERLEHQHYDAILMDCQMPIMDGYTTTRALRARESEKRLARTPIIAMTANAMAGDREKCLNSGMDDYLSKPLNRTLLEQTLRNWLPTKPEPSASSNFVIATSTAPAQETALPAPNQPTLDQEVVRDLAEIMGAEFNDLVRVYLEDTPKKLQQLEQAAQANDNAGLIAPSHSLKSTSANLGALNLSEIAKNIEHGARRGELTQPLALVIQLNAEYQRVAAAMTQLLKEGNSYNAHHH